VVVLCGVERDDDELDGVVVARGVSVVIPSADGFGLRATDGGLRPPPPSSVEPGGIPTMPTNEPGPMDEAKGGDAVADAADGRYLNFPRSNGVARFAPVCVPKATRVPQSWS
jgi:hypothetical protein